MAATQIDVASKSLVKLGLKPISSFSGESDPSIVCGQQYPDYRKHCLTVAQWNFTKVKVQLARLTTAPLNKWEYAYQLPSDRLNILQVFNSDNVGITNTLEYEVFGDQVYTDEEEVYIDYQQDVQELRWPDYFTEFVATAFAGEIAITLTDKEGLADRFNTLAWGLPSDNFNGGLCGKAKELDAQQNPTQSAENIELIQVRF